MALLWGCPLGIAVTPGWREESRALRADAPNAEPTPACPTGELHVFHPEGIGASTFDGYAYGISADYPPDRCYSFETATASILTRNSGGPNSYNIVTSTFRYETDDGSMPRDAVITCAYFSPYVLKTYNVDGRWYNGEVYHYTDESIGCNDWTNESPANAWSVPIMWFDRLNTRYYLPILTPERVDPTYITVLRGTISTGKPTGNNGVDVSSMEGGQAPELWVWWTTPTVQPTAVLPEPTPTPHCFPDPNCVGCYLCAVKTPQT